MVISKLIKTKTNSKYLIGYSISDRPLVLIMPKMIGYIEIFKLKMKIKIETVNW